MRRPATHTHRSPLLSTFLLNDTSAFRLDDERRPFLHNDNVFIMTTTFPSIPR